LKIRKAILNKPRKEYMITLKVSRGISKNLLCVEYTISGIDIHAMVQNDKREPFMMVHHIKKVLSS